MHGPMLQGPVHNSWELKTSQFLHGQHTHWTCHPLSMFGMLWIGMYDKRVPVPANIQQRRTAIEEEWINIPQTTINNLINSMRRDVLHCMRQMVVTPDTDWFSDPPNIVKLHIVKWPFIVASLSILICHTCEVDGLSRQRRSAH